MAKPSKRIRISGARFNLGEPWDGHLDDFCAAHFKGSATQVVRAALDVFIPMELARDLATAERFHKLQADRHRTRDQSGGKADQDKA